MGKEDGRTGLVSQSDGLLHLGAIKSKLLNATKLVYTSAQQLGFMTVHTQPGGFLQTGAAPDQCLPAFVWYDT